MNASIRKTNKNVSICFESKLSVNIMPDHKRITGPESSISYRFHSKYNLKRYEDKLKEAFRENDCRKDGRSLTEMRKIFIKSGIISQAKGSAYIELGNTKVIVSVFDPREIPKQNKYSINGELFCDFKYSPFSCKKRKLPQTDADEKSLAAAMKRALNSVVCRHEFPNFQVDIFANILEDDGSVLGAAITCAGLALSDAGIPMYDVITATTIGLLDDKILNDPTAFEIDLCNTSCGDKEHGTVMISRLSTHNQISEICQTGSISLETLQIINKQLIDRNCDIVPIIKQILVKKIKNICMENNNIE